MNYNSNIIPEGKKTVILLLGMYLFSLIASPVIFYIYLQNDLVCEARAILSAVLFGLIPFSTVILGFMNSSRKLYHLAMAFLVMEMISTPIIMVGKLGIEKLLHDRIPAFFTFEIFALFQICLVIFLLKQITKP